LPEQREKARVCVGDSIDGCIGQAYVSSLAG
jgi:hypothetical protein